jgi:hypothetical protein
LGSLGWTIPQSPQKIFVFVIRIYLKSLVNWFTIPNVTRQVKTKRRVLRETIKLLSQGWTTGTWARNANGNRCKPESKNAVCWCPEGAMMRVCTDRFGVLNDVLLHETWVAFHDAVGIDKYDSAAKWNDKQKGVKPVIAMLRKAIQNVKE